MFSGRENQPPLTTKRIPRPLGFFGANTSIVRARPAFRP
jgi:hypothetical protein